MEAPGILAIFNNIPPGAETDFEEWFQHEHLAERIALPGFILGRRHEAVSGTPKYFNYYVTASPDVLKSPAYLDRLDHPTPMTRHIMSNVFKDMNRTVCRRTFRAGQMRGGRGGGGALCSRRRSRRAAGCDRDHDAGQGRGLR
jgi:hypothetical protein